MARPAAWCEAHHVRHWADGGRSGLANLASRTPRYPSLHRLRELQFRSAGGRRFPVPFSDCADQCIWEKAASDGKQ